MWDGGFENYSRVIMVGGEWAQVRMKTLTAPTVEWGHKMVVTNNQMKSC